MEEKLKKEIADIVESIFNSKKEDEMRTRTEAALKDSARAIEALTDEVKTLKTDLETASNDLVEAKTSAEEFETKVKELEEAKAKFEETKEEEFEALKKELSEKTEELVEIKKAAVAKDRMSELASVGVVREDKEGQEAKVKEMTDEEFASYKEELESIKASIVAELKKKADDSKDKKEDTPSKEEASDKSAVDTPPANIDPNKSVSAAMNMESYPSDDVMAKYADLGKAMAESMTKNK